MPLIIITGRNRTIITGIFYIRHLIVKYNTDYKKAIL